MSDLLAIMFFSVAPTSFFATALGQDLLRTALEGLRGRSATPADPDAAEFRSKREERRERFGGRDTFGLRGR
jgi:hypothetical protein